jgi:hypothetical protein
VKKHASSSSDKEGFMNSFPSHHSPRHRKKLSSYSCHVFIMSRKSVCKCNRSPSLRKRSSQSMSGKCRTSPFKTLLVAHIPSCPLHSSLCAYNPPGPAAECALAPAPGPMVACVASRWAASRASRSLVSWAI